MTLVKFNQPNTKPAFSGLLDDLGFDFPTFFDNSYSGKPPVNISENNDNFTIEVSAPGFSKEDIKVNIDNKTLTISSEKKEEKGNKEDSIVTRREFGYSSFKRSFTLPETVNTDKINAKYDNGVLSILIPKREEAKTKPVRTVKIS